MNDIGIPGDFCVQDEDYMSVQASGWELDIMNIKEVHLTTKGENVIISIGDTGANTEHRKLPLPSLVYPLKDGDSEDRHGHGSHIVGNAVRVAPNSELLIGKVMDDRGKLPSNKHLAKFIVWSVDNGASVINLSLGGPSDRIRSRVIDEAIKYAYENDVLIVAASGNAGTDVFYPASHPLVLAVGAIDHNKIPASFSNDGFELDLVAPGVDIFSAWAGNTSRYASGTSMAAPFVAGFAALIISDYHRKYDTFPRVDELVALIKANAKDLSENGYDTKTGHGHPWPKGNPFIQDNTTQDDEIASKPTQKKSFFHRLLAAIWLR